MQYYLDPDYRKEPPRNGDGTLQPHCCRCQKAFKKDGSMYACTVDYNTMLVHLDPMGKELIGVDCWKKIAKQ